MSFVIGRRVLLAVAAASILAACHSARHHVATPVTTTSVAPVTTTTTIALPPDPQPSPAAASGSLIHAWAKGDRVAAATVATPGAISVLFNQPYDGEVLNNRGCQSAGPNPVVCSWGPYAGASPTNPLFDVTVMPIGHGWYVSNVVVLG